MYRARSGARSRGSSTQAINRQIREHPIRFPVLLLSIGIVMLLSSVFVEVSEAGSKAAQTGFRLVVVLDGFGGIALLAGIVLLPIGIAMAARRNRNAVSLRCPSCGLVSGQSDTPFRIEPVANVSYVMVTCPRCRYDFTVDKYTKLA